MFGSFFSKVFFCEEKNLLLKMESKEEPNTVFDIVDEGIQIIVLVLVRGNDFWNTDFCRKTYMMEEQHTEKDSLVFM